MLSNDSSVVHLLLAGKSALLLYWFPVCIFLPYQVSSLVCINIKISKFQITMCVIIVQNLFSCIYGKIGLKFCIV